MQYSQGAGCSYGGGGQAVPDSGASMDQPADGAGDSGVGCEFAESGEGTRAAGLGSAPRTQAHSQGPDAPMAIAPGSARRASAPTGASAGRSVDRSTDISHLPPAQSQAYSQGGQGMPVLGAHTQPRAAEYSQLVGDASQPGRTQRVRSTGSTGRGVGRTAGAEHAIGQTQGSDLPPSDENSHSEGRVDSEGRPSGSALGHGSGGASARVHGAVAAYSDAWATQGVTQLPSGRCGGHSASGRGGAGSSPPVVRSARSAAGAADAASAAAGAGAGARGLRAARGTVAGPGQKRSERASASADLPASSSSSSSSHPASTGATSSSGGSSNRLAFSEHPGAFSQQLGRAAFEYSPAGGGLSSEEGAASAGRAAAASGAGGSAIRRSGRRRPSSRSVPGSGSHRARA